MSHKIHHFESEFEVPFNKRLPSFSAITIWDRPPGLDFAIKQLVARKKPYSVEYRKGQIRVWSESPVGNW